MEKNKEKLPLREVLTLNRRAFQIWLRVAPKAYLALALSKIVTALTPYVSIWFTARLLDELAGARDPQNLLRWTLGLLAGSLAMGLLGAALTRWARVIQPEDGYTSFAEGKIYFTKYLGMDFCDMDDPKVNDLYQLIRNNSAWSGWGLRRLRWQFEEVVEGLTRILGAVALSVSLFLQPVPESGGALTALNHPLTVLAVLALMVLVIVAAPWLSQKSRAYWATVGEEVRLGNRMFSFYTFMGIHQRERALDIRTYRQDRVCEDKMESAAAVVLTEKCPLAAKARGPMGLYGGLADVVSRAFTGVAYLFVCLKAYGGAFGVGAITQYVAAITGLANGVGACLKNWGDMRNNASFLKSTFEFLDIPNRMYQGSLTTEKRSDNQYQVEFRDVSFQYPGSDTWALRHVDMKFQVGRRLAVVGRNGSGKTTFIKLFCRLYDPTEGEILLNGIDIRKYRYDDYRNIFSVVFQDFQLLALPLGQNVAGGQTYDAQRVKKCLAEAGFGERLRELPRGLDTYLYKDLEKEGVEVSGGEAQKIAIARALYKEAPFLILDEPTAALDPVAEAEIYAKLNDIVGDRTCIYISHRLSSCRFCDDIAVFDHGQVVQQGSHEDLVADESGKYHQLWHAQAQYYTNE